MAQESLSYEQTAISTTDIRARILAVPWAAVGVLVFGLVVLYTVGFSSLPRAHNAAHDTRHASGFPCH